MPTKMTAAKPPVTNLTADDMTFCMRFLAFTTSSLLRLYKLDEWVLNVLGSGVVPARGRTSHGGTKYWDLGYCAAVSILARASLRRGFLLSM